MKQKKKWKKKCKKGMVQTFVTIVKMNREKEKERLVKELALRNEANYFFYEMALLNKEQTLLTEWN